jgi:hypothetical protein
MFCYGFYIFQNMPAFVHPHAASMCPETGYDNPTGTIQAQTEPRTTNQGPGWSQTSPNMSLQAHENSPTLREPDGDGLWTLVLVKSDLVIHANNSTQDLIKTLSDCTCYVFTFREFFGGHARGGQLLCLGTC